MPSPSSPAGIEGGVSSNGTTPTPFTDLNGNELALKGITDPNDSDVLCGRGGAALRHPGNQTYRRLVNLNKGLYITCLKTEKLKISRSIVAAIREQRGRFLEKDSEGKWFDIGDKKAIEKTSQALREGQPKLRQKIVEMGGAAAMESQFGHPGLYADQVNAAAMGGPGPGMDPNHQMLPPPPPSPLHQSSPQYSGGHHPNPNYQQHYQHPHHPHHHQQQQQHHPHHRQHPNQQIMHQQHMAAVAAAQTAALRGPSMNTIQQVQRPDPRRQEMHAELFQRLSLRDLNTAQGPDDIVVHPPHQDEHRSSGISSSDQQRVRQPYSTGTQRPNAPQELGMPMESQFSLMSEFSVFGNPTDSNIGSGNSGQVGQVPNESMLSMDSSFRRHLNNMTQSQFSVEGNAAGAPAAAGNNGGSGANNNNMNNTEFDRRGVFAKMKYNRPPSQKPMGSSNHGPQQMSQRSMGDGMPDIHMVESTMSLFSNLSTMSETVEYSGDGLLSNSNHLHGKATVQRTKVIDHSSLDHNRDIHWGGLGGGSKHSMMSGLSRIDDFSEGSSGPHDLSRKIPNVSTRSIAMSEISAFDMQERAKEDDSSSSEGEFAHGGLDATVPKPVESAKKSALEYDL